MAIALVVGHAQGSTDQNGFTTTALDTTNATLLVVGVAEYSGGPSGVVSDSKGGTWTAIGSPNTGASNLRWRMFYCVPTPGTGVGTGHTFTISLTANYPSLAILAFSGSHASAPLDQQVMTYAVSAGTSLQPSITPSVNNTVVVTGYASSDIFSSISAPFNSPAPVNVNSSSQHQAVALAHNVQTTATLANPTWTWGSSGNHEAGIVSFKEAAAGGGADLSVSLVEPSISVSVF